ncbi:MAG: hypothetical protein BWY43_00575 [candidate division WS2 bacterium ADurb.Bin280]|uniref:Uncharacterized protein n=1 Tax=candidate division WS2 bacterium ADurb.Bin280 TaxID=1852829 RepID=A0A1V5SE17_9BACT|nr:MAG: hypothetical protein BWY43_00575 [candidate division WS2 bacterium ADurb.Bin280]
MRKQKIQPGKIKTNWKVRKSDAKKLAKSLALAVAVLTVAGVMRNAK